MNALHHWHSSCETKTICAKGCQISWTRWLFALTIPMQIKIQLLCNLTVSTNKNVKFWTKSFSWVTVNKSAVCIKIPFAVSQMQQMAVLSLEKYENNVMHFTNSPSISLCFKRLWLKTMHLPVDYHVTKKEKYRTSN